MWSGDKGENGRWRWIEGGDGRRGAEGEVKEVEANPTLRWENRTKES